MRRQPRFKPHIGLRTMIRMDPTFSDLPTARGGRMRVVESTETPTASHMRLRIPSALLATRTG